MMRISAIACVLALSGCSLTERLNTAATTIGTIKAGVNLPAYPADCRAKEPHYQITVGAEARSIIVGERSAVNRANARVGRCAAFYDAVSAGFGPK